VTTRFPDLDGLRLPDDRWSAFIDWAHWQRTGNEDHPGRAIPVFIDAPDPACAEARALMVLLFTTDYDLRQASAEAAPDAHGGWHVTVTVHDKRHPGFSRIHHSEETLAQLWATANPPTNPGATS
jgi:hypothetical protein